MPAPSSLFLASRVQSKEKTTGQWPKTPFLHLHKTRLGWCTSFLSRYIKVTRGPINLWTLWKSDTTSSSQSVKSRALPCGVEDPLRHLSLQDRVTLLSLSFAFSSAIPKLIPCVCTCPWLPWHEAMNLGYYPRQWRHFTESTAGLGYHDDSLTVYRFAGQPGSAELGDFHREPGHEHLSFVKLSKNLKQKEGFASAS